jgi:hypothetical protein
MFMQLVTPENPVYLHGYEDSSVDIDIRVPPISGGSVIERHWVIRFIESRTSGCCKLSLPPCNLS